MTVAIFPWFESQPQDEFLWTIVDIRVIHSSSFQRFLIAASGQRALHVGTKSHSYWGVSFGTMTALLACRPIGHRSISSRAGDFLYFV